MKPSPAADRQQEDARPGEKTVAFVVNMRFYRVGKQYYAETPNILDLFQAFRRLAGRAVICAPTREEPAPPEGTEPVPDDLSVFELPYYSSNLDLILRSPVLAPRLVWRVLRAVRNWDIVGGDAPSGMGLATVILAILAGKTGFLYPRGHITQQIRREHENLTWRGILIMASIWPLDIVARILSAAGVVTFAMGQDLARRHRGPRTYALSGYARTAVVGGGPPASVDDLSELHGISYVGRVAPEKGIDVLIKAVARLVADGRDLTLTITGHGPEMERMQALARGLAIDDRVTFTGNIMDATELRRIFLQSGIFVLPSLTEGVPVAMLEAMALGRVVVASRTGGIPSALHHEENGLLVEPGNVEQLTVAIARLNDDPELAFRLARGALCTGSELTLEKQAAMMMRAVGVAVDSPD